MAFSEKLTEEILEIKSHLRSALRVAVVNEKPTTIKTLTDILYSIECMEKSETIMDMLEKRKFGDSGIFGTFFEP